MWESKGNGNPEVPWLKEIGEVMENCKRSEDDDDIIVTVNDMQVTNAIKKKKNWSSPGPE